MSDLIYIIIICLSTVAVDWALYSGARTSIELLYRVPKDVNYVSMLFPRVVVLGVSGLTVGLATVRDIVNMPLALIGCALFAGASIYVQVLVFFRSERY